MSKPQDLTWSLSLLDTTDIERPHWTWLCQLYSSLFFNLYPCSSCYWIEVTYLTGRADVLALAVWQTTLKLRATTRSIYHSHRPVRGLDSSASNHRPASQPGKLFSMSLILLELVAYWGKLFSWWGQKCKRGQQKHASPLEGRAQNQHLPSSTFHWSKQVTCSNPMSGMWGNSL